MDNEKEISFIDFIKPIIKIKGINRETLSKKLNVSKITISRYLNGKTDIPLVKALLICDICEMKVNISIEENNTKSVWNSKKTDNG